MLTIIPVLMPQAAWRPLVTQRKIWAKVAGEGMRKQPWMKRAESELTDLFAACPKVWRCSKNEGLNKEMRLAQRMATMVILSELRSKAM